MKEIHQMTLAEVKEEIEKYAFVIDNSRLYSLLDQLDDLTRWIPVGERMPEAGEWVLAWMSDGAFEAVHESYLEQDSSVTHWQRITPPTP